MRKSLSEPAIGATALAVVSSTVLVIAAVVDQTGGRSLADHAGTVYVAYDPQPDPSLLYGLLYAVAALEALLWLVVLAVIRRRHRWASSLTAGAVTTTAALALLLLFSTEYGARIFPPVWGALALLPPAAGVFAVVLLRRRVPEARS